MSTTFPITLGGVKYEVPRFNLGQLRQITQFKAASEIEKADIPFTILAMALKRATPPVPDEEALLAIEPGDGEFEAALIAVMEAAGLRSKMGNLGMGEARPLTEGPE